MKACIECRWSNWPSFATGDLTVIEITAACEHPQAQGTSSLVVGGGLPRRPCMVMRGDTSPCGPDGKLWEGKGGKP